MTGSGMAGAGEVCASVAGAVVFATVLGALLLLPAQDNRDETSKAVSHNWPDLRRAI